MRQKEFITFWEKKFKQWDIPREDWSMLLFWSEVYADIPDAKLTDYFIDLQEQFEPIMLNMPTEK